MVVESFSYSPDFISDFIVILISADTIYLYFNNTSIIYICLAVLTSNPNHNHAACKIKDQYQAAQGSTLQNYY